MGTGDSNPLEVIIEGLLNNSSVLHSRYINTLNMCFFCNITKEDEKVN